jgi:hypothetical protein
MTNKLTTTLRLMMVSEPKEDTNKWINKQGQEVSRVRELLQGHLLGSETPLSLIDIDINKFSNGSQFRNVKLTDLFKMFVKNEEDLKIGRKILLAEVELLPVRSNFASDAGNISSFKPFLTGFTIADPSEQDIRDVELINRVTTDTSETVEESTSEEAVA